MSDPVINRLEQQVRDLQGQIEARRKALLEEALPRGPLGQVLGLVASEWGVEPMDLLGPDRSPRVVTPRSVAMAIGHRALGYSHERVGRLMNRHNTTVASCIRTIEARCEAEPELAARMNRIAATIRAFPKQRADA